MKVWASLPTLLVAVKCAAAAPFWAGYPSNVHIFPPSGAVVVAQDRFIPGAYPNVTAGVNALPTNETGEQYLFIYPGVYKEQVYIPARDANLTIYGFTFDSSSYQGNTVNITYDLALINTTSDDLTATVRVWSTNIKIYNLNILNTFGHINEDGQNLAVSARVGNQGYYGCGLYSYQDTLYAQNGYQLYAHSLIVGAIDFIFGRNALAWFHKCDIRTIAAGCVTASGREEANSSSWYVINKADVRGINETWDLAKQNYLGRPWADFARVLFQESYLGNCIQAAGWSIWDPGEPNTSNVTFAEYKNYGPGSILEEGPRANFSVQFREPLTLEYLFGEGYQSEWWVDNRYLDP